MKVGYVNAGGGGFRVVESGVIVDYIWGMSMPRIGLAKSMKDI